MKKKYFLYLSPFVAFLLYLTMTSSSGGYTGVSTTGCGGGTCHGSAASTSTVISLTGLPAAGYTNGTVYPITITVTNTSIAAGGLGLRDGFDMTSTLGSFTAIANTALNGATEIRHTTPKAAPGGTTSWTFNWTAPASGSTTVTFRIAANATNGDGSPSSLDKYNLYTTTLAKASALSVTASSTTISCNGGSSTITATAANGVGTVQYKLNAGAYSTNNIFNGNLAGTYTVTAIDGSSVTASTVVTISQPTALVNTIPVINSPTCNGGTGSASLTTTGGTGAKTYTITPLGPQTNTTGNFSGLTAQNYTITSTDANGCSIATVITLTQPTALTWNASTLTLPSCNGGSNGSIQITANGGTGTKTYTISPSGPQSNTAGTFSNLSSQTYTVTVTDANLCSNTTTVSLGQPVVINFVAPSVTNTTCNGGNNGAIQIIAIGGTGTKFYSINPLGPQTTAAGLFSNLTAQHYTITVVDANSCSTTTSVSVSQPAPVNVSSSNVSGCQGTAINLIGSPAGGSFSVANPYTGPSTTYTYSYTDGNGCTGVSSPSNITVTPVTNTNIVLPSSSSYCETLTQVSGSNLYSNSSCELITSISATGLGSTIACSNFLTGTPSWNGEPYANRVYSITPTTQPLAPASVCLYYTAADLTSAGISLNSDISITKVGGNGVLGGSGSVVEIPNSSMTISTLAGGIREVCFQVTSFSSFYLHSKNVNNIPLSVSLSDLNARTLASSDIVSWTTKNESNNHHFNIQYSTDGIHFENIGEVRSKALNGNSSAELKYQFENMNPRIGTTYYRLEQVDIDGHSSVSASVSVNRFSDSDFIEVYPNPTSGLVTIQSLSPIDIVIVDMNGKTVYQTTDIKSTQIQLQHAGVYSVRLISKNGQVSTRKLIVN